MFWLSHHPPEEWNRTYALGRLRVCARCLGTYPVLFAALLAQGAVGAPLALRWDLPVVLALTAPALLDWSWGRFAPSSGSNALRTLSGVFLGLALGRTLYVHVRHPWPSILLWQLGLVSVVALPVLMMASRRKHE